MEIMAYTILRDLNLWKHFLETIYAKGDGRNLCLKYVFTNWAYSTVFEVGLEAKF